jgi:hypothetical protein
MKLINWWRLWQTDIEFRLAAIKSFMKGVVILGIGAVLGIFLTSADPQELHKMLSQVQRELVDLKSQNAALQVSLAEAKKVNHPQGNLTLEEKKILELGGQKYADLLSSEGFQGPSDLVKWFIGRWIEVLDETNAGDRLTLRADLLVNFIQSMRANINPGDFVAWELELRRQSWLLGYNASIARENFPRNMSEANPRDSLGLMSICELVMIMNQTVSDADILLAPNVNCSVGSEHKFSLFLSDPTLEGALTQMVNFLRTQGYLVVDSIKDDRRQILIGKENPAR